MIRPSRFWMQARENWSLSVPSLKRCTRWHGPTTGNFSPWAAIAGLSRSSASGEPLHRILLNAPDFKMRNVGNRLSMLAIGHACDRKPRFPDRESGYGLSCDAGKGFHKVDDGGEVALDVFCAGGCEHLVRSGRGRHGNGTRV